MKISLLGFILSLLVSIFVGMGVMLGIQSALPAKTQIINSTQNQNVHTENTSIQQSAQAQIMTTLITDQTNYNYSVNYKGATNVSHFFQSKTNKSAKTNARKEKLIPFL